ncbi:MAG: GNAT family N-acetyltransferase [Burkholderiaceae bacterium]
MEQPPRQPAVIRRVHLPDAQAMQEFLLGLSGASRRNRFHGAVNGVSPSLLRRLVDADGQRHAAWVACIWGANGEEIVGEAVWYVVDPERGTAELAISVSDAWHGQGVANELMRTLVQAARDSGLRELYGDVLHANGRMLAFMHRHGMEPGVCDPPEDAGIVRLGCLFASAQPAPSARTTRRPGWWARLTSHWS